MAPVTTETSLPTKTDPTAPTTVAVAPVAPPAALGVSAAAPVAPVSPAPVVSVPLLTQVSGPVFSLAQGTAGEQTVTITVTPENLGPVTVQARTTGGAMHIELFAPTNSGRQALQVLLTDLRRDLAIAGIPTSVTLSTAAPPHPGTPPHPGGFGSGDQQRDSGAGGAAQPNSQQNGAGQTDVDQHGNSQHTASTPAQNTPGTNRTADDGRQLDAEALSDRPAIGSNRSLDVMA